MLKLDGDKVAQQLKSLNTSRIRKHALEVDGVLYPVKAAFAHVTGLDLLDFTTNQARHAFQRLGFLVKRVG